MPPNFNRNEDLERLFLLELLVDSIEFDLTKTNLEKDVIDSLKQTCVRFQFLNYPMLEVCEQDFCPVPGDYKNNEVSFKSGKSCLFSLRGLPPGNKGFGICVSVLRQQEDGTPVMIGRTSIQLGSSFTDILGACAAECEAGPVTKTAKDCYIFSNDKGTPVGKIIVFVRLSCFGKMIVTQFQIGGDENKSFLFKGADVSAATGIDRDKSAVSNPYGEQYGYGDPQMGSGPTTGGHGGITDPSVGHVDPCGNAGMTNMPGSGTLSAPGMAGMSGIHSGMMGAPGVQGAMMGMPGMQGGMMGMPGMQGGMMGPPGMQGGMMGPPGMQGGMMGPPGMQGGMMGPPGMQGGMMGMPGMQGGMMGMPGMQGGMFEGSNAMGGGYKQISAQINGHPLDIKVRRGQKAKRDLPYCGKMTVAESSSSSEDEEPPAQPDLNFCNCDYPLPPGFGVPSAPRKKKKKKKAKCPMELAGTYCLKSNCPMGYPMPPNQGADGKSAQHQLRMEPGAIGMKGDQVLFQLPPSNQTAMHTNTNAFYNMGGNMDPNLQKVQIMNEAEASRAPAADPEKDVFILKIGKKTIGTDQRAKLELELKTPKLKHDEPKFADNETQYLESDLAPGGGKDRKGSKKGKGGKASKASKGGKGGKGKGKKKK